MKVIGAIDIGGTKIAVGAVTEDGTIVGRCECATRPEEGFALSMRRIKGMLVDAALQAGAQLDGIGIACPGPLDPFTGLIGDVGTLPRWQGGNLVTELEPEFGVRVAVENDADAAALAEASQAAAKCSRCFIYITVSTGIGGGIILSGDLYRGVDGTHPELGHQVIDASGPMCYCKGRGCWESLASGPAMVSWVREQEPRVGDLTAAEICARAQQGDQLAWRAVEREGHYLGLGLANLITLFCPDRIALGGGVMKSSHLFLDRALQVIREICTQVPAAKTQITLASLGSDTGLVGAAQAWLRRYR
jgi:glucokinase